MGMALGQGMAEHGWLCEGEVVGCAVVCVCVGCGVGAGGWCGGMEGRRKNGSRTDNVILNGVLQSVRLERIRRGECHCVPEWLKVSTRRDAPWQVDGCCRGASRHWFAAAAFPHAAAVQRYWRARLFASSSHA